MHSKTMINPDGTLKKDETDLAVGQSPSTTITDSQLSSYRQKVDNSKDFNQSILDQYFCFCNREFNSANFQEVFLKFSLFLEDGRFFKFMDCFRQAVSARNIKRVNLGELPPYQQILFKPARAEYKLAEVAVLLEQDFIRDHWSQIYFRLSIKKGKNSFWKIPLISITYGIPLSQLQAVEYCDFLSLYHQLGLYPVSGYRNWAQKYGLTIIVAYINHTFGWSEESDNSISLKKNEIIEIQKKILQERAEIRKKLAAQPDQAKDFNSQEIEDYVRFCSQEFNPANFQEVFLKLSLYLDDGWFSQFVGSLRQAAGQLQIDRFDYPRYQRILFGPVTFDYSASEVAHLLEEDFLRDHWKKLSHDFPLMHQQDNPWKPLLISLSYQIPLNQLVLTKASLRELGQYYPRFIREFPDRKSDYLDWAKEHQLTQMTKFLQEVQDLLDPMNQLIEKYIPSPLSQIKTWDDMGRSLNSMDRGFQDLFETSNFEAKAEAKDESKAETITEESKTSEKIKVPAKDKSESKLVPLFSRFEIFDIGQPKVRLNSRTLPEIDKNSTYQSLISYAGNGNLEAIKSLCGWVNNTLTDKQGKDQAKIALYRALVAGHDQVVSFLCSYFGLNYVERFAQQTDQSSTTELQETLAQSQAESTELKESLAQTQEKLTQTEQALSQTRKELIQLQGELAQTQKDLTKEEKESARLKEKLAKFNQLIKPLILRGAILDSNLETVKLVCQECQLTKGELLQMEGILSLAKVREEQEILDYLLTTYQF